MSGAAEAVSIGGLPVNASPNTNDLMWVDATLNSGGLVSARVPVYTYLPITTGMTLHNNVMLNPTLSGTANVSNPLQFATGAVVMSGQTGTVSPLVDNYAVSLSGTLGDGVSTTNPWHMFRFEIANDQMVLNNANLPVGFYVTQQCNTGMAGGRDLAAFTLAFNGTIEPDANGAKSPQATCFSPTVQVSASVAGATFLSPKGSFFSMNPKATAQAGAVNLYAINAAGETNIAIVPSSNTYTFSGTPTGGETIDVHAVSTAGSFDTHCQYVVQSTDPLALVVTSSGAAILNNATLANAGVGIGLQGATSTGTLADYYAICWPQVLNDITLTATVIGSSGITITPGTPVVGASVGQKYGMSIISLKTDGSQGYIDDTAILFGKQSGNAGWTAGPWSTLLKVGGGTAQLMNGSDAVNSSFPMARNSQWIIAGAPTGYSGTDDAPVTQLESGSIIFVPNVNFTGNGSGPIVLPGFQIYGDGATQIGSASISRLTGSTSAAGIQISANGWEGTSVTLASGGGSGSAGGLKGRYYVGDIGTFLGCFLQVTAVDNTGAVTAFSVVTDSNGHTNYPCAPPGSAPSTTQNVLQGSGTGWTVTVVWTAANTVKIVASTISLVGTVTGSVASITDVTHTYTTSGTITLTDNGLYFFNSSSALAITLANGGTSAIEPTLYNYGTGAVVVSGTIAGGANTLTLNPQASGTIRWLPSLTTWVVK